MNEADTWSPTATLRTPGPTSAITPAPSWPPMIGKRSGIPPISSRISGVGTMSPVTRCSSLWHIPATFHSTSTSPAFGGSTSTSTTSHAWSIPRITPALLFITTPTPRLRQDFGGPVLRNPDANEDFSAVDHHPADVLAAAHVVVAVVHSVERVGLRDETVEIELPLAVEVEELRDVGPRVA